MTEFIKNFIQKYSSSFIKFLIYLLLIHFSIRCISEAATSTFSFDGAMNAQVSQNLLQNASYATNYNGGIEFDQRIQTGITVLLPVSILFSFLGETFTSGLVINAIYLILLLISIIYLLYKIFNLNEFLLIIFILFFYSTPKLFLYGFGLYGEIPTLLFLTLFFIFFYKYEETKKNLYLIISGIIFSLGYLTKTIILISIPAILLVLILDVIKKKNTKNLSAFVWNLGIGFLAPLLAFEIFKLISLGKISDYVEWWRLQINSIFKQAGFTPGFEDTSNIFSKFSSHLNVLSLETKLNTIILILFLLLISGLFILSLIYSLTTKPNKLNELLSPAKNKLMILITTTTVTYVLWWLFITPSQKAWYRRIINGYILMELCIVLIIYLIYRSFQINNSTHIQISKFKTPSYLLLLTLFIVLFANSGNYIIPLKNSEMKINVKETSDFIQELPINSTIYGYNWWQSPILAFEAKKVFYDINQDFDVVLPGKLENKFLVVDQDAKINGESELEDTLENFEYNQVFSNNHYLIYSIIERKFPSYSPFSDQEKSLIKNNCIDFSNDPVNGFFRNVYSDEPDGIGKWAKMYSGYLLKYSGESNLTISTWFPELNLYPSHPINLEIFINNELLTSFEIEQSGKNDITIPILNLNSDPFLEVSLYLNSRLYPENDTRELAFRIIKIELK